MLTDRELDIIGAALSLVSSTNSEGMQEVNFIRGKLDAMRLANKNAAKEVPANGGNVVDPGPTQTV